MATGYVPTPPTDTSLLAKEEKQDTANESLVAISDKVATTTNIAAVKTAVDNLKASQVSVVSYSRVTNTGTVASGLLRVSFANAGTANATVLGTILKPGETVDLGGLPNRTLPALAYAATGTELLILQES